MEIKITRQDINKALQALKNNPIDMCNSCPTAQALKRLGIINKPSVGYTFVIGDNKVKYYLSEKLKIQVMNFTMTNNFESGIYEILPTT